MIRIRVGDFKLEEAEKREIISWLDSGRISEGPNVKSFEEEWARFIGVKHCVLTNSGTSALIAGLDALKHLKMIKKNLKS